MLCLRMQSVRCFVLIAALSTVTLSAAESQALTKVVGDKDSFGFSSATIPSLTSVLGQPADRGGPGGVMTPDGRLDAGVGDLFPDISGPVHLVPDGAVDRLDEFDHRSAAEKLDIGPSDEGLGWFDVALPRTEVTDDEVPGNTVTPPGNVTDVVLNLTSLAVSTTDPYFGAQHFITFAIADCCRRLTDVIVDGVNTGPLTRYELVEAGVSGASIDFFYAPVSWAQIADNNALKIEFAAGEATIEPYVSIDYAVLSHRVIPEPSTGLLIGFGLAVLSMRRRSPWLHRGAEV